MPYWGIHLAILLLYAVATVLTYREIRDHGRASLWFVLLWLLNVTALYIVLLVRDGLYGWQDPPQIAALGWWARVCRLHGGLAILGLLWDMRGHE